MVCWYFLSIYHRFQVINENSIWRLQNCPITDENYFRRKPLSDFLFVVSWFLTLSETISELFAIFSQGWKTQFEALDDVTNPKWCHQTIFDHGILLLCKECFVVNVYRSWVTHVFFHRSIMANYRSRPLGDVLGRKWRRRSIMRPRFSIRVQWQFLV